MASPISSRKILASIKHAIPDGADVDLVRCPGPDAGYWYFSYSSEHVYETESMYTVRLNDMPLAAWTSVGLSFLADMATREADLAERRA